MTKSIQLAIPICRNTYLSILTVKVILVFQRMSLLHFIDKTDSQNPEKKRKLLDPHFKGHGTLGLKYSYQCLNNTYQQHFLASPEFQDSVGLRTRFMDTIFYYLECVYVYMYVCMFVCIYICICIYIYIHIYINTYDIYIYIDRQIDRQIQIDRYTYTYTVVTLSAEIVIFGRCILRQYQSIHLNFLDSYKRCLLVIVNKYAHIRQQCATCGAIAKKFLGFLKASLFAAVSGVPMLQQPFHSLLTKELKIHPKLFQKQYINLYLKDVLLYKRAKTLKRRDRARLATLYPTAIILM